LMATGLRCVNQAAQSRRARCSGWGVRVGDESDDGRFDAVDGERKAVDGAERDTSKAFVGFGGVEAARDRFEDQRNCEAVAEESAFVIRDADAEHGFALRALEKAGVFAVGAPGALGGWVAAPGLTRGVSTASTWCRVRA
jgi:hypothetical protein